jgi:hypothetical protein
MSATPTNDTKAPVQKRKEQEPQEKEQQEPQETQEPQEEKKQLPKGALPVVKSYELDLPKGKRARTQFDAEVDAILRRIVGSMR